MTRSIRTRVAVVFTTLIGMAAVESVLVLFVQREVQRLAAVANDKAELLAQSAVAGEALAAMQGSQRGFLLLMDPDEAESFNRQAATFDGTVGRIRALTDDPELRTQFEEIVSRVAEWRAMSLEIQEQHRAGVDVIRTLATELVPRFQEAQRQLTDFEDRQAAISRSAVETSTALVRRVTIILTAVPLVAIVFIATLFVAAERTILRPLAAVAASAKRLAAGDYDAPLPAAGRDEIGVLVDSFRDMRAAVQGRAHAGALARRRLEDENAEVLAIINTVPAALVILEPDGAVRLQNKAAEHLLGITPDSVSGRKEYWRGFAIRDRTGRKVRIRDLAPARALAGIEIVGEEIEVERPDGRRTTIIVSAAPLRDAEGRITGAVAGFQDITRLHQLDRMKDEFVAITSHELRTPMTAIRGSLQLVLADNTIADPESRQLLEVALHSCERLVRIINDMLDISKIEAGRLELRPVSMDVASLVRHASESVQTVAAQAGIAIQGNVPDGISAVKGDPDRLTQALVNLLSNAIKFAPRGSEVVVAARDTPAGVAVRVTDRGRGIAAGDIPRLFRKFQQLDDPGTRRAGGTGLGLAITKAIIEQHGGTIDVQSTLGQGTTFEFVIPRVEAAPAIVPSRPAAVVRRTVLVVDPDATARESLVHALTASGFEAQEVPSGAAAVQALQQSAPDAITVAFGTADAEGGSAAEALSQIAAARHIPLVITMSETTLDAGDLVSEKPVDLSALVARVQRVLDGRMHAKVLVADDDSDLRFILRKTLERHGLRVLEAADGREALALADETIDLVLLDLDMPHVHGHDVIRALRHRDVTAQVPIIVLSGSVGARHSLESLVLGANVFLTKPADPAAVVREVERLLRRETAV